MAKCDIEDIKFSIGQCRKELKNIRQSLFSLKEQFRKDFRRIEEYVNSVALDHFSDPSKNFKSSRKIPEDLKIFQHNLKPIGFLKSMHMQKNGTPRQGSISSLSRGILSVEKRVFNNSLHSLEGLKDFSHIWLIFVFHKNKNEASHAKVSPPRLDGAKIGVFASRSPHRPNALGLTLAQLDSVEGNTVYVSGIDILDGTPVIDIKPYIPQYDLPRPFLSEYLFPSDKLLQISDSSYQRSIDDYECNTYGKDLGKINNEGSSSQCNYGNETERCKNEESFPHDKDGPASTIATPKWVETPPINRLKVIFNPIAIEQIKEFDSRTNDFRLEYLKSSRELKSAITCALSEDPRSHYRRQKCTDRLYYLMVDSAHVTAFFCGDEVEVLRVSKKKAN